MQRVMATQGEVCKANINVYFSMIKKDHLKPIQSMDPQGSMNPLFKNFWVLLMESYNFGPRITFLIWLTLKTNTPFLPGASGTS